MTIAVVVALWWAGTAGLNGDKLVTARLDALRTGLGIGIGGGGALALYLSWRRQRAAEITLAQAATALTQKDRDHEHVEADARERRITDLYTKAVEQLGSDKAPVRLGGLYALERLAQDNPPQRQTIVNVLCAYLRMPYSLPGHRPADDAEETILRLYRERVEEREVRQAAQRILADHLRLGKGDIKSMTTFWPGITIDLTNAVLVDLVFSSVDVRAAKFSNAQFVGDSYFSDANFSYLADFNGAHFGGSALFARVCFEDFAGFLDVRFDGYASFAKAEFKNLAAFSNANFGSSAYFEQARFDGVTRFDAARFDGGVNFTDSWFGGTTRFDQVHFGRNIPDEVKMYLDAPE
ncbi:pentapeptide repeat-containing protein [Lentzea pudingi]|uniref:pentapeptide repeat-containing protein n=1 Tax=Lentzea pudingi TaxID=1789439 RepID=UPI0016654D6F|nr:pentapeptide repeat-containing protein [Lentzea pudingi]